MVQRPYGGASNLYNGIGWLGLKKIGVIISEVPKLTHNRIHFKFKGNGLDF